MNQAAPTKTRKPLFRRWMLCNIVGFILSFVLMIPLEFVADTNRYVWLLGLICGVALSPLQAIALKPTFPKLKYWQWIAANIVGMYAAITLNLWLQIQLAHYYNPLLELARYGAVIGLCVGAPQLIILGLHTKKAFSWWLANILAWAIAVPISSLIAFLLFLEPLDDLSTTISAVTMAIAAISIGLLMGSIYAAITSFSLVAIARSSQ
ncbi:MAG: hypothetical protein HC799_17745 [Limnothrix sp. RL_2_0]|nr:hypothetical protein [Limnothrix sp. RL_2_0]